MARSLLFDMRFAALLVDMDGTILNSTAVSERVWGEWARKAGLDVAAFLPTMHGRRVTDTIAAQNLPAIDIEKEAAAISAAEIADVEGIVPIGGALPFLASLARDKWAVVTSAPRALAVRRLEAAGITAPDVVVTSEDVTVGKPAPDCYALAARRLGVEPAECLVIEDAPPGIAAAEAVGATILVVSETHRQPLETPHVSVVNFAALTVSVECDGRIAIFVES